MIVDHVVCYDVHPLKIASNVKHEGFYASPSGSYFYNT